MKILVSSCLLGENCKYSGGNNYNPTVAEYVKDKEVIKVCPEMLCGLGCPRVPLEIVDGALMNRDGENFDSAMRKTISEIIKSLQNEKIDLAILQSRSPTCGVNQIYDGTFSGKLIKGQGLFAKVLAENGYNIIDSEDLDKNI